MNVFAPNFTINIAGWQIGSPIVYEWAVMVILIVFSLIVTRKMSTRKPNKIQTIVEMLYSFLEGLVIDNVGEEYANYVPVIGTMFMMLLLLDLSGLVGFSEATSNLSVTAGFTVITFCIMHGNAIKKNGPAEYLKGYARPYIPMILLNLMELFILPLSLCLRLFGNMLAAAIVMGLIYTGLNSLGWAFQLVLPIPAHLFFDAFDGVIQTIIFVMLTVMYMKLQAEH
ncbi:MAG: F0F1 ATP synthase subunit A [Clostridium perfringens]|nr:F0F1 ATP synthase subunit A [Clostridium perfringens]